MSLYLKNNYYTKIEWSRKDQQAKVTFPSSIIFNTKRLETNVIYNIRPNQLIVDYNKKFDCPNYAIRTAIAVDVFRKNINVNIPCSEIYFFDQKTEKTYKFAIKYLAFDLKNEELEKERYLADVFLDKKKQTLSDDFDVSAGFEFVSSIIESGGL